MSQLNLLRLFFSNILSFKDEQEILFTAESKYNETPECYINNIEAIEDNVIAPVTALYGANASGKSNFIKIFDILSSMLGNTNKKHYIGYYQPFMLDEKSVMSPSKLVIDFCCDNYRYVLDISFSFEGIISEILTEYRGKVKNILYNRKKEKLKKIDKLKVSQFDIQYIEDTLGKRNDLLVLDILDTRGIEHFHKIFEGLKTLIQIKDNTKKDDEYFFTTFAKKLYEDKSLKNRFVEFLKYADLGIEDIKVTIDSSVFYSKNLSTNFTDNILNQTIEETVKDPLHKGLKPQEFFEEYFDSKHFYENLQKVLSDSNEKYNIYFIHKGVNGKKEYFTIENESLGTFKFAKYLMKFIPALLNGGVFVIDELESNLHPMILAKIIELFNDPKINIGKAQLIFSSHNTSILRNDILKRDEIWFVEKNDEGCSEIYPLTDFNAIRKGFNYEKGYWEGRFGAIPYLNEINELADVLSKKD